MTEEYPLDETLDELADYVIDIGDDIAERDIEDLATLEVREREYDMMGNRCEKDNDIYYVVGHPELRFVSVVYFLSLSLNIGNMLDIETMQALVDDSESDIEESELRSDAAELLLDDMHRSQMEALKNYAYMFISGGSTYNTEFYTNEEDSLIGFSTGTYIFPYEDDFNIRRFYEAVQQSLNAGTRGKRVLQRSFNIEKDEENPSRTELSPDFSW